MLLTTICIACVLLSALSTWWGVRWFVKRAQAWALMDRPNERSSHSIPTPRGGGLFFFPVVSLIALVAFLVYRPSIAPLWLAYSLFAAGAFSFLGFRDDISSLSSQLRFALQFLLVIPLVWMGPDWPSLQLPYLPEIAWGWTGKVLLVFWFVGMINVYNFMDGIDGIAVVQGVVVCIGCALLAFVLQAYFIALVTLAILGSLIGFLFFNWHPAKVFMGDVGSNFLGFIFAWLPLACIAYEQGQTDSVPQISATTALAGFCLLLSPFLLDGSFTFLRRLLNRENVFAAHRSHLYQRLVQAGLRHNQVSLLYFSWALLVLPGVILTWAPNQDAPIQSASIYISLAWTLFAAFGVYTLTRKLKASSVA
jgi:Fuc2NAc and GlcNAc transferase